MGHADMEDVKCPTCDGPMCDGRKYMFGDLQYRLSCFIPTTAYCENGYYKNRGCHFCVKGIPANKKFQQCEQWLDCEDANKSLCLMDCCGKASCMEACSEANVGCKFVEREGCHGKLSRRVAVRFGKTPSDTEIVWLWEGEKAPVNVLSSFEFRQLATVFSLGKIKGRVRELEFALQMRLDQCFEGIVVLTPENAPALMTPDTPYCKKRCVVLKELELVETCLFKIDKLCRYVYDNMGYTTDEAPFNELVRDIDMHVDFRRITSYSINRINLEYVNLKLTSVAAQLEPRKEVKCAMPNSAMHPEFNRPETCHRFNTWMQLPQVDSPIYHQHQKFVDRIAPLVLASFWEQQQCEDKALKSDVQATTQSLSNDEPSAKRSRIAAGGSDL